MGSPTLLEDYDGIIVVRDDLSPGGTKGRVFARLYEQYREIVYACSAMSCTQIALAEVAAQYERQATLFVGKRAERTNRTRRAIELGATVYEIKPGYLSAVRARARHYASRRLSVRLMSLGFNEPRVLDIIADAARALPLNPTEVWCAAGSGTLTRALQRAWPDARHCAVQVGKHCNIGRAVRYVHPLPFEKPSETRAPFPSELDYDAKAWEFCRQYASPGAVFWNVMGEVE